MVLRFLSDDVIGKVVFVLLEKNYTVNVLMKSSDKLLWIALTEV